VVAALERGFDLVVAAGGDGTIMEVANALIDADVPLGIIPLGTGNLLAFNLNIPFQIREALRVIVSDTERTIDIIRVNHGEHFFAIMGGIGFDAKVMDDTDRDSKHRFGRLAYLWTAVQNLEGELFEAILSMDDGEPESVRAKSILIANMGQLGPNVNAFPGVDPDSGIMQVGILKASHAADFARLVAKTVVDGSPADDPFFDVYSCRSLTVTLNSPQPFEYDGNVIGMVSDLTADVMPHALRVRIPKK
jgi:diacylglycerol kinase (ATP)